MHRGLTGSFVAVILAGLFIGGYALGQSATDYWPNDQNGKGFRLFDVASVNVNGSGNADSCFVDPNDILFTPALSSTNVTLTRAAQNGSGNFRISNDNQAGLLDVGAELTRLVMTSQGIDNGGDTFAHATYFGVRADAGSYPGNRDNQQIYFAPQSQYEVSGTVNTISLNGTTMLSPYYFRGETVGIDGTAGNNTRPDGISLGFFWDTPSMVFSHPFTANSYQTGEIFGPPCSGPTCYGLRIYGSSSDISERIAGTFVADGLGGGGTQCVQVDNSGKFSVAGGACGGSGSITALTHDVVATGPGSAVAEVVGITDGTSVDHPVSASAWTNGQALALDVSGDIRTAAFQAPLTACTDYVSVPCQTGSGSDIGGSNATTTVTGMHDGGGVNHATSGTWSASALLATSAGGSIVTESTATCAQLPALTGDTHTSSGACATVTDHLTDGVGTSFSTSLAFVAGEPLIATAGNHISTNSIGSLTTGSGLVARNFIYNYLDLSIRGGFEALWAIPGPINTNDTDGNAYEMAIDFAATSVRVVANITCNSLSATGYTSLRWQVTKNGSNVTGAVTPAVSVPGAGCSTPGTSLDSGVVSVSASAGDRFGVFGSGSNTGGGTFSGSVVLYVYQ